MASKKAKQTPEEVMRILTKISETSQKTLDSISDIVWTVNPKNDLMEDLFMRMRLHTSEILETQSISYEFNADRETENIKMTMERRKNIYLIFKESVNNIAKYSKCTHVLINAELNNGNVELEITDNGIGFHEGDVADSGNGLKNMKLRASQIKGKISIESKPGEGTTIRLIFPYT
jgi:signal transduction histidine kinase